jgi:hypothetical protein
MATASRASATPACDGRRTSGPSTDAPGDDPDLTPGVLAVVRYGLGVELRSPGGTTPEPITTQYGAGAAHVAA